VGTDQIWDSECSTQTCFGVPMHRLDLMQSEVNSGGAPPRIMMMGQDVGQRSTLSVNHGNFYLDTTKSLAQQRALRAGQVSVFEAGHTYYAFLLFAKPTTRQTYTVWVGPGFDVTKDVQAYRVDVSDKPSTFHETIWPSSWPNPVYNAGYLTVQMDMNFTDFQNGYASAKQNACQPETFCSLDQTSKACGCALGASDPLFKDCQSVCSKWAGHDIDCPVTLGSDNKLHSSCYGFGFKLPGQFANGTSHTPKGACYPNNTDWNVPFIKADQNTAGSCYYTKLPTYQSCTQPSRYGQ
jgi:hypothetical protein